MEIQWEMHFVVSLTTTRKWIQFSFCFRFKQSAKQIPKLQQAGFTMPWNWKRDFSIRSVGMKSLWILWPDGCVLLRLLTRWKCPGLLKEWDKSVRSLGLQQDKSSRSEGLKGFHPHRPDGNVPLFENTKAWRHGGRTCLVGWGHSRDLSTPWWSVSTPSQSLSQAWRAPVCPEELEHTLTRFGQTYHHPTS